MSKKIRLSVVIPAYNEESNLKKDVLDQVFNYLKKQSYPYEVIIVDDGSKDETVQIIEQYITNKPPFVLIKNEHGGKAITVLTGLLAAKGEISVFTDMDQATPLREIEKFFPQFDSGDDIVIGARSGRRGAPLIRKISATGFSALRNIILGLPFKDTQCGFKAFNQKAIQEVAPILIEKWDRMRAKGVAVNAGFDVELLYVARKKGLKIIDVDVNWSYVETERVPLLNNAIEAIKDMLRIRFNDLTGKY